MTALLSIEPSLFVNIVFAPDFASSNALPKISSPFMILETLSLTLIVGVAVLVIAPGISEP